MNSMFAMIKMLAGKTGKKAVLLAPCLILLLSGCAVSSGGAAGAASGGESAVVSAEESIAASAPEDTMPSVADNLPGGTTSVKDPVQGQSIYMMTGKVEDAGMSSVTISSAQYPDGLSFYKADADTGFSDGLVLGRDITLFFSGEVKGTDTSQVKVLFLRDAREDDPGRLAGMITGKVMEAGMSSLVIQTEDGRKITFNQGRKPVNKAEGPTEGEVITVLYSYIEDGQAEPDFGPDAELILSGATSG